MREEIISYIQKQQYCKLNYVTYPWFVAQFGADVTFLRAWGCGISAILNGTIVLFRDWPFYSLETWWRVLLEIGSDIIFFCFFGPVSVLCIGLFSYFMAIVIWSFLTEATTFKETRKLENWETCTQAGKLEHWQTWEHIQAVLQEKIVNTVFILTESYLIFKVLENWEAWGPRLQ